MPIPPANGIVFNNTFSANVSQAYQNCVLAAEQDIASRWSDSITLNLNFDAQAKGTNAFLASNSWPSSVHVSYAALKGALAAHATSPDALAAVNTLPVSDPNPAGGRDWTLPEAYARHLGLSPTAPPNDDSIVLNTSYDWSFGQDVISTMEHEITEGGMGRVGGLGDQNGEWSTMDLFRYSAAGTRDYTDGRDGNPTYFSADGNQLLLQFNNEYRNANKVNSGDTADFAVNDVFGTGSAGDSLVLSATDLEVMNVLGWTPDTGPAVSPVSLNVVSATRNQSFAASSLFTYADPRGDAATLYDFWDTGSGGGFFALNGQVLGANQDNVVFAAQLAQVTYQSGLGTDRLWVRASDGAQWSDWSPGFTVSAPIDAGPVVTPVSLNVSATHNQSFAASSLFTFSDPFGDAATQYDFWNMGSGGGYFALSNQVLGANQDNVVSAAQLAQVTYQSGSGADTLWVRASDGAQFGPWSHSFTVTAPIDTPPVVAPVSLNVSAAHNQSFAASSLFTYTDSLGDAATQYDFWDTGSGGGYFALNNQVLGANQDNIVSAAQLAQVTYQSGSGADTLWVRASDGAQFGPWSQSFTVTAPIDPPPVVAPVSLNVPAAHNQSFAASSLFTYSNQSGDAATQYDFWDTGSGGGYFALNGQVLGANQDNIVSAAQLAQVTYQSGSGADTLWVRASDGTQSDGAQWSPWSHSFTVTAPIDPPPAVAPVSLNVPAANDQSFAASSLFTYADQLGDAATRFDFWDTGSGGGYFALNGQVLGANQDNVVSAAQLAQVTYQSGSGADTLWVRASDGAQWSPWSHSFTVTAPIDAGPVVNSVSNIKTVAGQSFAAASLFTASDPFGDAIARYDFWDRGTGGGHFLLNGQMLGADQDNIVSAAQLAQTTYVCGAGADTLWVRVNEGNQWSPWSPSFTISDPATIGAGETLELSSAYSGAIAFTDTTGTLRLDDSSSFTGTVSGLSGQDTLDLRDVTAGAAAKIAYSGDAFGGTLTVTDGNHMANITLVGSYLSSSFVASDDGHGGTAVVDPSGDPVGRNVALLTTYMASAFASPGIDQGRTLAVTPAVQEPILLAQTHQE